MLMYGTQEIFCEEDKECELIRNLIELIGEENTMKFIKTYAGANVYVPKCEKSALRARDREIYSQYRAGANHKELSRRYGLAEKTIRDIVHKMEDETQKLRDPERNEQIRADYKTGMPIVRISDKYRLSVVFIRTIIKNDKL